MSLFFTSDTHFGHGKLALLRGFANVEGEGDAEAMDNALVKAWNQVVTPSDTVYHLGDLSFARPDPTVQTLLRLNGKIKLVPGNHDLHSNRRNLKAIQSTLSAIGKSDKLEVLERLYTLKVSGQAPDGGTLRLELCHFPILVWDRGHYGALHLHGHSHGHCKYPDPGTTRLDVGVDAVGMHPLTLSQVLHTMAGRKHTPHDLHASRDDAIPTMN